MAADKRAIHLDRRLEIDRTEMQDRALAGTVKLRLYQRRSLGSTFLATPESFDSGGKGN